MAMPLFEASDDWQLRFDLKVECDGLSKNKPFPPHILAASRRPDGVMWSDKLKGSESKKLRLRVAQVAQR